MGIFIDPPQWPAHGTLFSHLISDTSVAELHDFATAAGVSRRAFDRDHYDVPRRLYPALVALGAHEVDGRTLTRTLLASGLRIRARERSTSVSTPLRHRWQQVMPEHGGLGDELLERWGEPHRHYHDRTHLLAVLEALDTLGCAPMSHPAVVLAAWFHDAVHTGAADDEEASARLAQDRLSAVGVASATVAQTARLVRLTATHDPARDDAAGALICDADLAVLGRDPAGYDRYAAAVRAEYADVPEPDFRRGRAAVLARLSSLEPLFHTETGGRLWQRRARANLSRETQRLTTR